MSSTLLSSSRLAPARSPEAGLEALDERLRHVESHLAALRSTLDEVRRALLAIQLFQAQVAETHRVMAAHILTHPEPRTTPSLAIADDSA